MLHSKSLDGATPRALTLVCIAAAYALAGFAALRLTGLPGLAAPLFPAAGIALASVLVFGWRVLPAVALGSVLANLASPLPGLGLPAQVGLLAAVALGAVLQAAIGAMLIRRLIPGRLTLSEPRDVGLFLGASVVSCLVNASVSTAALLQVGAIGPATALSTWTTWGIGDALGVLTAAPVVLTLIGVPRDAWATRRLSVGLTMLLAMLLLALGARQVARWSDERLRTAFDRDAAGAAQAMVTQLQEPLRALDALRGVFIASADVTREELQLATQDWLAGGTLQAMGWAERVPVADIASFEEAQRQSGIADFRVFDRPGRPADTLAADASRDRLVTRYIEPLQGNAAALGVNILSVPAARAAVDAAIGSGRAAATAVFRLTQQNPLDPPHGVVIYRAIYAGPSASVAERQGNLRGVVFATLRMDAQLAGLAGLYPPHLKICLVDTDPLAETRRLAGALGCENDTAGLRRVRELAYAGRQWDIRVSADAATMPRLRDNDALLFSLVSLLSAAMLGGFLLVVTGRTRRIETAVRERTAALQSEVREREVAEAELRESERRFRGILDNVPIGMLYADLDGHVLQTNPSFCELIGYSEDEVMQLDPADYTHPEDLPQDLELQNQLLRGEIPMYRRPKRLIAKDGSTVWVQATVSLLRDAQGQARRVVGVVENITEHLRLEEAEHARELAESSNRAKSEFLSRMSHELRTPLNAMLGFAQLLELDMHHPLAETQRPWVSQIQQAGWHLLEMINDVLDLSRIESGNVRLQTETLMVAELLRASLSMVEGDAQRRRIEISQDLAPGTNAVIGDATRVKQILTNLLSNAVKYNADGGRIHVTTRTSGAEMIEITVIDTGLGMTPDQMAQLFQPFNRLGRERSAQEGTGIGLVISQRLAELMGGSLRARSVSGQGSSFILSLPRAADVDTVRSDLHTLDPTPTDYHRRIVHYVEDNETNVEVMRGILAQRKQVQLQVSVTGLDGLAAMRITRPDLILLDMHLPDISGMELLRHMKADPHTAAIPVVVVSADALARQIEEAFEAGASHYLTKPVSVSELLAVVDTLLDRMDTRFG